MKLPERIRSRRIELNLTQEELAQKMGYKSRSSINKIELGISDITQSKIIEFAKNLDCTPEYLMGWEDEALIAENNIVLSSKFSKRLKELREQNNYSMDRLIALYNEKYDAKMNKSTLSRYENNLQEPIYTVVVNLADFFGVTVDYIIGGNDAIELTPYNPTIHKIPVLGYISAGLPLYAEEHITDYTYTERNGGAEYFALKVKGDSMSAAQINDGNTIIVRKQNIVEDGEIAVIRVNDEDATVKRFKRVGDIVQLIPQSFNPEHEIQIYDLKNTDIQIIGKVVECKIEF